MAHVVFWAPILVIGNEASLVASLSMLTGSRSSVGTLAVENALDGKIDGSPKRSDPMDPTVPCESLGSDCKPWKLVSRLSKSRRSE